MNVSIPDFDLFASGPCRQQTRQTTSEDWEAFRILTALQDAAFSSIGGKCYVQQKVQIERCGAWLGRF
jgi:hypothetical protein